MSTLAGNFPAKPPATHGYKIPPPDERLARGPGHAKYMVARRRESRDARSPRARGMPRLFILALLAHVGLGATRRVLATWPARPLQAV